MDHVGRQTNDEWLRSFETPVQEAKSSTSALYSVLVHGLSKMHVPVGVSTTTSTSPYSEHSWCGEQVAAMTGWVMARKTNRVVVIATHNETPKLEGPLTALGCSIFRVTTVRISLCRSEPSRAYRERQSSCLAVSPLAMSTQVRSTDSSQCFLLELGLQGGGRRSLDQKTRPRSRPTFFSRSALTTMAEVACQ